MPAFKSLLLRTEVITTLGQSKCQFNKAHVIARGDLALEMTEQTMYGPKSFRYCWACAGKMLQQDKQKIARLGEELKSPAQSQAEFAKRKQVRQQHQGLGVHA